LSKIVFSSIKPAFFFDQKAVSWGGVGGGGSKSLKKSIFLDFFEILAPQFPFEHNGNLEFPDPLFC
jgi:hypothetical protein